LARAPTLPPRPRYSVKTRIKSVTHDPPDAMKRYKWKEWKKPFTSDPKKAVEPKPKREKRSTKKKTAKSEKPPVPVDSMDKKQILTALKREHPQTTHTVGVLKANIQASFRTNKELAEELFQVLNEAVTAANKVKRDAQRLIGLYMEYMARVIRVSPTRCVEPDDRKYLDGLCQRITKKKESGNEDDEPASSGFLGVFLRCLYSGNEPSSTGVAKLVAGFMKRLEALGLYQPPSPLQNIWARRETSFTPSDLVRSVSTQLGSELMRMYCDGTVEMQEKVFFCTHDKDI
jgi:hypothetical protein